MDLISIVVPIYDVEEYLHKCIDSLLVQTYKNIEIILVDDGAKDKSGKICDEYAAIDERVQVIHKKNGGLSDARNAGIDIAKGKYIGFVDSDDWIKPTMYEKLYSTCVEFKAAIATCGRIITDGVTYDQQRFIGDGRCLSSEEALGEILLGKSMDVAAWDKLYRADLFEGLRYPKGENNEDIATFYILVDKAKKIAHTGTVEYFYRSRPGSITKLSYREYDRKIIFKNLEALREFIEKKYPSALDAYKRYYAINVYFLLNKYIKCNGIDKNEEFSILMNGFKNYYSVFKSDSQIAKKEKYIASMIVLRVYEPYLKIKKMIKGRR